MPPAIPAASQLSFTNNLQRLVLHFLAPQAALARWMVLPIRQRPAFILTLRLQALRYRRTHSTLLCLLLEQQLPMALMNGVKVIQEAHLQTAGTNSMIF